MLRLRGIMRGAGGRGADGVNGDCSCVPDESPDLEDLGETIV